MTDEEKMIHMYNIVHGEVTGSSCHIQVIDHYSHPEEIGYEEGSRIALIKDGTVCWTISKTDLLFDYMTRDLDDVVVS